MCTKLSLKKESLHLLDNSCFQKSLKGAVEIAQWLKCLPHKHEAHCSDPQTPRNLRWEDMHLSFHPWKVAWAGRETKHPQGKLFRETSHTAEFWAPLRDPASRNKVCVGALLKMTHDINLQAPNVQTQRYMRTHHKTHRFVHTFIPPTQHIHGKREANLLYQPFIWRLSSSSWILLYAKHLGVDYKDP